MLVENVAEQRAQSALNITVGILELYLMETSGRGREGDNVGITELAQNRAFGTL